MNHVNDVKEFQRHAKHVSKSCVKLLAEEGVKAKALKK